MDFKFYFHELLLIPKIGKKPDICVLLNKIKSEIDSKNPYYIQLNGSKLHFQVAIIMDRRDEIFFMGKMILSHKAIDFREEISGVLYPLPTKPDSGLCHNIMDMSFFILHYDKKTGESIVMLEHIPFSLSIGAFVAYLKQRMSSDVELIDHKLKIGRDIVKLLKDISGYNLIGARIQLRKSITSKQLRNKFGLIDDALVAVSRKGFTCELILKWDKRDKKKLTLLEFFRQFFKIGEISELQNTNFGEFLRIFSFTTDNEALPPINVMDKILVCPMLLPKAEYLSNEKSMFEKMMVYFDEHRDEILE